VIVHPVTMPTTTAADQPVHVVDRRPTASAEASARRTQRRGTGRRRGRGPLGASKSGARSLELRICALTPDWLMAPVGRPVKFASGHGDEVLELAEFHDQIQSRAER
jgi:hypothetical protein